MATSQNIRYAAKVLNDGGVIAYPTEGVFGLGCLPGDVDAVARILSIKERDPEMGLVVIDPNRTLGVRKAGLRAVEVGSFTNAVHLLRPIAASVDQVEEAINYVYLQ